MYFFKTLLHLGKESKLSIYALDFYSVNSLRNDLHIHTFS